MNEKELVQTKGPLLGGTAGTPGEIFLLILTELVRELVLRS